MSTEASRVLEQIRTPALIVTARKVSFANPAAKALLGAHIEGEDVRIALRDPDAVALILGDGGGTARLQNLGVGGSVWELDCRPLGSNQRLVALYDLSIQAGTARAHADFVANASHELRTPLAAILGYVETLQDPKAGDDRATRERFLSVISREASRMQALVEDLMSLSRIEAVKHEAPEGRVDMVEVARSVAGEFRERASIDLSTNDGHAAIAGDRSQMAQALRNLVDNAVKYGKPDAPVRVTLETTPTGWLVIEVRDQGDGIAPEHLPRLTERFYRADAGRSRAAGGTGLGLAIVKHIVERHRGRFDITSRPGSGTTASIMLPLHPESGVSNPVT